MKKTSKTVKRVTAAALAVLLATALVLAAGACGCRTYRRDTFDYNSVVFKGVDLDEATAAFADARSQLDKGRNAAVNSLNNAVLYLNSIGNCMQYAYVEYNKDTQSEYADIYAEYNAKYNELVVEYYDICYEMTLKYPDVFSAEETEMIREQHDAMGENYAELNARATELAQEYYTVVAECGSADTEECAQAVAPVLTELVSVNNAIAKEAGYDSYADYAYEYVYDRDYTPSDAAAMCEYVKEYIAPLARYAYDATVTAASSITAYSPAFSAAPGEEVTRNMGTLEAFASEMGDDMNESLAYLFECNVYYAATPDNDPNATQGAFTTYLGAFDAPYIYQYCTGGYGDLMTFVHEFGHFNNYYVNGANSTPNLDISEIHSQANEMLFNDYLDDIYGRNVADYIIDSNLFNMLYFSVIMGCVYDEFQQTIYAAPESYTTAEQISDLYERLIDEYDAAWYGDIVNASADDGSDMNRYWWTSVPHTFNSPFYYISYAVSAVPALSIWQIAEGANAGRTQAIEVYNKVVDYGVTGYSFSEMLKEAQIPSPFLRNTYAGLADFLGQIITVPVA